MPEFWNDKQKLCTDNNKVYHYVTWPGITSANMIYKTQQNFEKAMRHSSNCQITGNLKIYWATVPLLGLPPKFHLSIKTVQGSLHGDLQQSGTFRRSHQPRKCRCFRTKMVEERGNSWKHLVFLNFDTGWCVLTCINHIHNGFLWDVSLKILHDRICRLKTQLSAWTTRTCHPNPQSVIPVPGQEWFFFGVELPSCCLPGGPQKVLGADHRDSSSRKAAWKFHSWVETEWFKAALHPLETLHPYCNRILGKKAVDTAKWAIALIGAENQTALSKGPWCYCPGVVEQSSW